MSLELSREEQENVAGLLGLPAYQILLRILQETEKDLLAEMSNIGDAGELLKATRFWQVFKFLLNILETQPQSIRDDLDRLEQEQGQRYDELIDPMSAWIHGIKPDFVRSEQRRPDLPPNLNPEAE